MFRTEDMLVNGDLEAVKSGLSKQQGVVSGLKTQLAALTEKIKETEQKTARRLTENRVLRQSLLNIQKNLAETEQQKSQLESVAREYDEALTKQSAALKEVEDSIKKSVKSTQTLTLKVGLEQMRMNMVFQDSSRRAKSLIQDPEARKKIDLYTTTLMERNRLTKVIHDKEAHLQERIREEERESSESALWEQLDQRLRELEEEEASLKGAIEDLEKDIGIIASRQQQKESSRAKAGGDDAVDETPFATLRQ